MTHPLATRRALLAVGLALGAAPLLGAAPAAAQGSAAPTPAPKLRVVASFSILADLAREVGGGRVEVAGLVGPDGDAHVYQPTPADARRLAEAGLIAVNGLGFEGWIDRLIKASGTKAAVVVASKGVKAAKEEGHGHDLDPHAWQDVRNVKLYVANLRDALAAADPAGKAEYEANAAAYTAKLDALDAEVRAGITRVPAARRKVITTHDAFGYFGRAYGMTFIAPQGVSTESEASAKDVARIIRQVKAERVPAVFLENVSDPRLAERLAKESGARIGGKVYSDALSGEGGPAASYLAMMRHNLAEFTKALAEG